MSPVRRIERGLQMNLLNFRVDRITVLYYFIPVILIYSLGSRSRHTRAIPHVTSPLSFVLLVSNARTTNHPTVFFMGPPCWI
jgi:hypothetical protein